MLSLRGIEKGGQEEVGIWMGGCVDECMSV